MQFDFTLAGYGAQNIETAGRFVKYVKGAGQIRVRFDKGGYIDLLPGQGCTGLDFSRLTIEDRSGAINTGVLLAGAFMFQDDRISGTVDVIDGGRISTTSGKAFMVAGGCGGVASTLAVWQLWNPVGSGKRVILGAYMSTVNTAAGPAAVRIGSTALPTLQGTGFSKLAAVGQIVQASAAQIRSQNRADSVPVGDENTMDYPFIPANTSFTRVLREPIVLLPGTGILMLNNAAVAVAINGTWEWTEEAL